MFGDSLLEACVNYWGEGYYAWELTNIRRINPKIKTSAKRTLYKVELLDLVEYLS
jgi:hypothetical protein